VQVFLFLAQSFMAGRLPASGQRTLHVRGCGPPSNAQCKQRNDADPDHQHNECNGIIIQPVPIPYAHDAASPNNQPAILFPAMTAGDGIRPISRAHRHPGSILPTAGGNRGPCNHPFRPNRIYPTWAAGGTPVPVRRTPATLISGCIRQLDQEKVRPDRRRPRWLNWKWLPFLHLEGECPVKSANREMQIALCWMKA
jgi:hypothetical protein